MNTAEQLEMSILGPMYDETPSYYRYCYFFPFKCMETWTGLDRELIRGLCKSMRNRGIVEYGHGFDEDGYTAGAGYTLTRKGEMYLKDLWLRVDPAQLEHPLRRAA